MICRLPLTWILIAAAIMSGCYAHTDFIVVEPVRYVPPPSRPIPNAEYGWVSATEDNAVRYKVRVGDLTYKRIIEPYKVNGKITSEAAISAFSSFAEGEVVKLNYCGAATVPADAKKLIGSNTPPEMWIHIQCEP